MNFLDRTILKRGDSEGMQISQPYNVVHVNHVRPDNRTSTGFSVISLLIH